jgi:O-antigen/teichoic acid export membrane protein
MSGPDTSYGMSEEGIRRRTIQGIGWSGAQQAVQQLLKFVFTILLMRLLTPDDFGQVGMILVFAGIAQLFSELGLGAAVVQRRELRPEHLDSVFWANIAAGAALTALFAALAGPIALFYELPSLRPLTLAISLTFFIGSFRVVQYSLLQRSMAFRKLALVETVAVLLSGGLAVGLALAGYGIWSLVGQLLALSFSAAVLLWLVGGWRPSFSFRFQALRELFSFSFNLLGFSLLDYSVTRASYLLIGKFIGAPALGIYSRADQLMLMPVSQVAGVISRVMFPALSAIQDQLERVKQIYLRAIRAISLLTFPVMLGLMVTARPFVLVALGEQWAEVIPLLQVFCLAGMTMSVGTTVGWIYTSQGRTDIMMRWGLFAGVVRVSAIAIGLRWGILGVAVAWVASGYLILWYPSWAIAGRLINLRFSEMVRTLSGNFLCAAGMAAAVFLLGRAVPETWPLWLLLGIQVTAGAVIYILLILSFRVRAWRELRQLWEERRKGVDHG